MQEYHKKNFLKTFYGKNFPHKNKIEVFAFDPYLAIGITNGKFKKKNEDCVGFNFSEGAMKFAVADGHWGRDAAEKALDIFLKTNCHLRNFKETKSFLEAVEKEICDKFPTSNYSPETSIIWAEIWENDFYLASYGDCLAFTINANHDAVLINHPQKTWLGKFSHLGVEGRKSISDALEYQTSVLEPETQLFLCTDGVIDLEQRDAPLNQGNLSLFFDSERTSEQTVKSLLEKTLSTDGKDNATCLLYKV